LKIYNGNYGVASGLRERLEPTEIYSKNGICYS
ncbi:hypothetical protein T06_11752, partial [Trichinella sp. T6]